MAPYSSGPMGAAPSLVIVSGAGRDQRIAIPDRGIVLGRDERLGPPFSTDEFVSREHVSVYPCEDGSAQIADLGSANGTFVNGIQVHGPTWLRAGDVLRIGQVELKLAGGQGGQGGQGGRSPEDTIMGAPAAGPDLLCLVILAPTAHNGLRYPLTSDYVSVGRERGCDIWLDNPHVSRTHAALQRRGSAVSVQDLGSSGGTFVNGVPVTAARELQPGDVVAFASVQARLEIGAR